MRTKAEEATWVLQRRLPSTRCAFLPHLFLWLSHFAGGNRQLLQRAYAHPVLPHRSRKLLRSRGPRAGRLILLEKQLLSDCNAGLFIFLPLLPPQYPHRWSVSCFRQLDERPDP